MGAGAGLYMYDVS